MGDSSPRNQHEGRVENAAFPNEQLGLIVAQVLFWRDAEVGTHGVLFPWPQRNPRAEDIAGFDASHLAKILALIQQMRAFLQGDAR